MNVLEGDKRFRAGILGIVITMLVTGVGQSFGSVPMLFATPNFYALFADSGGLNPGDVVRLNGMDAGVVRTLVIDGTAVRVGFGLDDVRVGSDSRVSVRTDTILGKKVLEIEPRGGAPLAPNAVLPLDHSTTPYQIYNAIDDVTRATQDWDLDSVRDSLNVLSETISSASPALGGALDGVAQFSDTIGKRDEALKEVLSHADTVAGVLGNRSGQIRTLLVDAQTLLSRFNERQRELDALLGNVGSLARQIEGFVNENTVLNQVLTQLHDLGNTLVKHKTDLTRVLATLDRYITAIGEAIGSGPYFKVMVANLLPGQFVQPFIDAAFKKRGIDPQEFWGDAGLPSFRFPDPNGQRHANGAPPAAPTPLEGTPEHPGPAVVAGTPCSYTPGPGNFPTSGNPLPCTQTDVGPFGTNPYGADYGGQRPDVVGQPPNPAAAVPSAGVPSAAFPGETSPIVPGIAPPPLVAGPPGARTVPATPGPSDPYIAPGSLQGDGTSPPPPALVGPPPPPGPGPRLPGGPALPGNPPFLPPGSQG